MYVQIRAGSDIAFLGGLINYVLTHEKWFKEYVLAYTNASTIIADEFVDTEDLGGIFSGYQAEERAYDAGKGRWAYADAEAVKKHKGEDIGRKEPEAQGPGGPGPEGRGNAPLGGI